MFVNDERVEEGADKIMIGASGMLTRWSLLYSSTQILVHVTSTNTLQLRQSKYGGSTKEIR